MTGYSDITRGPWTVKGNGAITGPVDQSGRDTELGQVLSGTYPRYDNNPTPPKTEWSWFLHSIHKHGEYSVATSRDEAVRHALNSVIEVYGDAVLGTGVVTKKQLHVALAASVASDGLSQLIDLAEMPEHDQRILEIALHVVETLVKDESKADLLTDHVDDFDVRYPGMGDGAQAPFIR